jgi:hypothetical protein
LDEKFEFNGGYILAIMPFTRHFYESEEVCAALQSAILNRRIKESAFWLQELIDSGDSALAFHTLIETWLFYIQVPGWLEIAKSSSMHEAAMNLALYERRDTTVFSTLALQGESVDRITVECGTIANYLLCSIRQGRPRSAWWAAQQIGIKETWALLPNNLIKDECKDSMWLCATLVLLCNHSIKSEPWKPLSVDLCACITKWASLIGRRARRVYAIPITDCVSIGRRWTLAKGSTNLGRLYDIEKSICIDGSGFWYRTILEHGFTLEDGWRDDNDLEKFYTLFPDDQPDEWSLSDQTKSHGSGMLRSDGETVSVTRWWRCWLSPGWLSVGTWGSESEVLKSLSGKEINHSIYKTLTDVPMWTCKDTQNHIRPVLRKYTCDE